MTATVRSPDAQYRRGTFISMGLYVITLCAVVYLTDRGMVAGPLLYGLAALPGLAIAGQIFVTLRYLKQADEYIRTLLAKRLIVASLGTFALISVWGFLETFANVAHLPGWSAYCLMWFLFGLSGLVIRDTQ